MTLKAVIFDMDGVIVDSEKLHDITSYEFFAARGIIYERDLIKPLLMGKSSHEVAVIQKNHYHLSDSIEDIISWKATRFAQLLDEHLTYIPGFLEYHTYITDMGLQSIVATGSSSSVIDKVHAKVGIKNIFGDRIITVDQVGGIGKPNPALFLGAMHMVGRLPEECLIIEDATNGIMAAKAAYIKVIGLATTLQADVLATAQPDFIAHSFDDVHAITANLLDRK